MYVHKLQCLCFIYKLSLCFIQQGVGVATVEPPNKGHVGTRSFVLYREVSFIRRLKCTGIIGIGTSRLILYREVSFIRSVLYRRFYCIAIPTGGGGGGGGGGVVVKAVALGSGTGRAVMSLSLTLLMSYYYDIIERKLIVWSIAIHLSPQQRTFLTLQLTFDW